MTNKAMLFLIFFITQFICSTAQSPIELTLKWTTQNDKRIIACTVKNIGQESITIYEKDYKPLTFIFPDGHRIGPYRFIICGPYRAKNILLSPNEQETVFSDPSSFFDDSFSSRKLKEHGEYQILWEVNGMESNVLTYQFINPYLQDADLLNNPEITWAAKTETLFHFSSDDYERLKRFDYSHINGPKTIVSPFQTLKSDFSNLPISISSRILEYELGRLIQNKNTQFLNFKGRRMNWDTVQKLVIIDKNEVKLNRENSRKHFIYENGTFTSMKPSFIVRQLWYYNEKNKKLQSKITAISPIIPFPFVWTNGCGSYGEPHYHPEVFARFGWINMPQSDTFDFNLNREELIWSRLSTHDFDFQNAKILKGNTSEMFYQIFYKEPLLENREAYAIENFTKNSLPLTEFDIQEIVESRVDTLISFNPVTYKEQLQIKNKPEIKAGDISKFQITQQWYWDAALQQFAVQLKTMRPQVGIKNEKGETKWQKPLYILKFD